MKKLSTEPIFYVYVYLDPRKPDDYNYGTSFILTMSHFMQGSKGSNGRDRDHLSKNRGNTKNKHFKKQNKENCL